MKIKYVSMSPELVLNKVIARLPFTFLVWTISYLIFVTTGDDVIFSSQCPFLHRDRKILANFGYLSQICARFGTLFTGLNSAVVPKN